jgi:ParB family chromosome partitioning protein
MTMEAPIARLRVADPTSTLRVRDIPLSQCRSDTNQPRKMFDEASLRELANSIERHDLLQPITVRRDPRKRGHFVVVAGERRYRAFELLGRSVIPAIITGGNADEIALIENLQREDLSPFEEASALARLKKKHGYTLKELGASVAKAESTVANLLKINDLPRRIRNDLSTSKVVGRSFLMELARLQDGKEQLRLWEEAKRGDLTVRDLRRRKRASSSEGTSEKRTLALGRRFVTELHKLGESGSLDDGSYEQLLEIYEGFLEFFDERPS